MQSTSNYHARKYGVRAAMPGFIAKKLCPNLVIVPTNFTKYRAVSDEVRLMAKHTNKEMSTSWNLHENKMLWDSFVALCSDRCSWMCIALLGPGGFCRIWPSLPVDESGWSLSGFYRPPGAETELARILSYTSLPRQRRRYRQDLITQKCGMWCFSFFLTATFGTFSVCIIWRGTLFHDQSFENPSGYCEKSFLFCKGEEQIGLPQEAAPEEEELSPVLFEDSPSTSLCLSDSEGVGAAGAAGSAFEVFGTSLEEAVREMRFRIEQKTMLTASAGKGKSCSQVINKTLSFLVCVAIVKHLAFDFSRRIFNHVELFPSLSLPLSE